MRGRQRAERALAALLVAGAGAAEAACTPELCTRHSECPQGYECSSVAQCEKLPDAAPPPEPDAGGGEEVDSGTGIGMGPVDAGLDASPADEALEAEASLDAPGGLAGAVNHPSGQY